MKRSEHFNVVAGKWLNGYSLSVNGRKYAISGVSPDNKLVLHCLDANDIVCEYSDLSLGSSHIFVNDCDHVICDARRVFVDGKSHHELYVVDKGDEWRSYWVEGSYVIGANCCTIRSISDFLREKNMVKFRATLEKAGSGFRDKILEIMKKNSYEFEF